MKFLIQEAILFQEVNCYINNILQYFIKGVQFRTKNNNFLFENKNVDIENIIDGCHKLIENAYKELSGRGV